MEHFFPLSGKGVQELGFDPHPHNKQWHASVYAGVIEVRGQSSGVSHLLFEP